MSLMSPTPIVERVVNAPGVSARRRQLRTPNKKRAPQSMPVIWTTGNNEHGSAMVIRPFGVLTHQSGDRNGVPD